MATLLRCGTFSSSLSNWTNSSVAAASTEMDVTTTNSNFPWYQDLFKCIWRVLIKTLINRTFTHTHKTMFVNFNYVLSSSEYSCWCSCSDSLICFVYLKFKCAVCCVLHIKMQIQYTVHRRCSLRFSSPFITLQKYLRVFFPEKKKQQQQQCLQQFTSINSIFF